MNDYSLTYLFITVLYTRFQFLCQEISFLIMLSRKGVLRFSANITYSQVFVANWSRSCVGLQAKNSLHNR